MLYTRTVQRIAIVGSSGSGKSTLAIELGRRLGLPIIHLDRIYWRPGWAKPENDDWLAATIAPLSGERWIVDGNYSDTLPERIARADTVIFLDLPMRLCLWRIINRALSSTPEKDAARPDLPEGCGESIDIELIEWVYRYRELERPGILALLETAGPGKAIVHLKSAKAVKQWLESVPVLVESGP